MIRPIFAGFASASRQEIEETFNIILAPNPTNGTVLVQNERIEEYIVEDILGRKVEASLTAETDGDKLDLSSNISGLYIARLKVRGQWFVRKIILNK